MDKDFSMTFSSDDELKSAFDELVDGLRPDIENEDSKVTMIDGLRLKSSSPMLHCSISQRAQTQLCPTNSTSRSKRWAA